MKRFLVLFAIAGCGGPDPAAKPPHHRTEDSAPAVTALATSKFTNAVEQSTAVLARDPRDSRAAAVRAIAAYQIAGHALIVELGAIIEQAEKLEFLDHAGGRAAWQGFLTKLEAIDRDLAVVAEDPSFSLELCLACWEHDWNRSGQIDANDRKLFELEFDGKGGEIAAADPRRRPTFRFDVGDAEWARAMIAFQRAAGELVLAYKWSDLDKLFGGDLFGKAPSTLTIKLTDRERVRRARELVIAGLGHADRCRDAYLAETDDDREWVPNPRQQNHPIPLEVDDELYRTWAGVTGDVRRMLTSEEGLSMRDLVGLADDDMQTRAPDAYIDLGRMLSDPKDIVIDLSLVRGRIDATAVEKLLRGVLGNGYQTRMKPSPLVGRLRAMKGQLDRDEDTFERKLRYLMWLN